VFRLGAVQGVPQVQGTTWTLYCLEKCAGYKDGKIVANHVFPVWSTGFFYLGRSMRLYILCIISSIHCRRCCHVDMTANRGHVPREFFFTSERFTFCSTYLYRKGKRALPGNFDSWKLICPHLLVKCSVSLSLLSYSSWHQSVKWLLSQHCLIGLVSNVARCTWKLERKLQVCEKRMSVTLDLYYWVCTLTCRYKHPQV
jgi:hypothetical protein